LTRPYNGAIIIITIKKEGKMNTILGTVGIFSLILAVGCIDGPTGHEMDNWWGFAGFTVFGLASMVGCLLTQERE